MRNPVDLVEALLVRLGVVSGFATLLIMVIVCIDVAGRAIFNMPFHSGTEMSELLLVSLVFLGLAAAQQQRQNFALDILTRHFPGWLQRLFELVATAVCLGLIVLLAWPSSKQALLSFGRGESGFGIVAFPVWPARCILAIGLWLLALQFAFDLYRLITGRERPAAAAAADVESGR
jgi:TRAP-type C4-dicarboxylate transport system permease small subunit